MHPHPRTFNDSTTPNPADVLGPYVVLRDVVAKSDKSSDANGSITADFAQMDITGKEVIIGWFKHAFHIDPTQLTSFTVNHTGERWDKLHGEWFVTKNKK